MFIQRKIEEIRQKPEHIRLRYVYFLVAIFTFLFFLIWLFSLPPKESKEISQSKKIIPDKLIDQKNELLESAIEIQKSLEGTKKTMENLKTEEKPQE